MVTLSVVVNPEDPPVNARRTVQLVMWAALVVFVTAFGLTLITKARFAGEHAVNENRRRESMKVDPKWPDWFRNMDRNTDGKLTREEFIGTDEQFRRIDADGNGEISPEEATAADGWFRNEVPK